MAVDQRVEFEIALRDSISPGLRAISSQLRTLNRSIRDSGEEGGGGLVKMTRATGGLGDIVKRTTRDVDVMAGYMGGFAKSMLGIGGATGAVTLAAKSLENFAANRRHLGMMRLDTGATVESLETMQQTMRRMGMTTEEADDQITKIFGSIRQMHAMNAGPLVEAMTEIDKGTGIAMKALDKMRRDATGPDAKVVFDDILEFYRQQTDRGKTFLALKLGVDKSILDEYAKYQSQVRHIFHGDQKAYDEYLKNLIEVRLKIEEEWQLVASHVIPKINDFIKTLSGGPEGEGHGISTWFNSFVDSQIIPTLKTTREEFLKLKAAYDSLTAAGEEARKKYPAPQVAPGVPGAEAPGVGFVPTTVRPEFYSGYEMGQTVRRGYGAIKGLLPAPKPTEPATTTPTEPAPAKSWLQRLFPGLQEGGIVTQEGMYHLGEGGKREAVIPLDAAGMRGGGAAPGQRYAALGAGTGGSDELRDMKQTEQDSNRTITDIRDILKRMEDKPGAAGGGGGVGRGTALGEYGATGAPQIGADRPLGGVPTKPSEARESLEMTTAGGSPYLAKERAQMFAEYDKWSPEQKRTLANIMMAENAKAPQDVLESLANRVVGEKGTRANPHGTLWEGLTRGFYSTYGRAAASARAGRGNLDMLDKAAAAVRGGSDELEGRSDQGMITDPGHREMVTGGRLNALGEARRLKRIHGEYYSDKLSIPLDVVRQKRAEMAAYDREHAIGGQTAILPKRWTVDDIRRLGEGSVADRIKIGEGGHQGDVREIQRQVAGIRKGALDPRLREALDYASAQTGLTVKVASGGQPETGPMRTGSHRHDLGKAADFDLFDKDGKLISPSDPRAIEFYRHAATAGVTGGGAGPGYMGGTRTHLDIDTEKLRSPIYYGSKEFRQAIEEGKEHHQQYVAQREEESRQKVAARADMDKAASEPAVKGKAEVNVDFKGANEAQSAKTLKDVTHMFSLVKQSRTPQNSRAGQVPEHNSTAYE